MAARLLRNLVVANHAEIVARASSRAAERWASPPLGSTYERGAALCAGLVIDQLRSVRNNWRTRMELESITGRPLLTATLAQLIAGCGDIGRAVLEIAAEQGQPLTTVEAHALFLGVEDACVRLVTDCVNNERAMIAKGEMDRLGELAHELRNRLTAAVLAFEALQAGRVAFNGNFAGMLGRNLRGLKNLIDRSLVAVRVEAGGHDVATFSVSELVAEVESDASLAAAACGAQLMVTGTSADLCVRGDRLVLGAALANLLQNAFKYGRREGRVTMTVSSASGRVFFAVEDECGGLPPGPVEDLFLPYAQRGANRTGIGLGLSICRKGVQASGGEVHVRDVPAKGCVFTVDLPLVANE